MAFSPRYAPCSADLRATAAMIRKGSQSSSEYCVRGSRSLRPRNSRAAAYLRNGAESTNQSGLLQFALTVSVIFSLTACASFSMSSALTMMSARKAIPSVLPTASFSSFAI